MSPRNLFDFENKYLQWNQRKKGLMQLIFCILSNGVFFRVNSTPTEFRIQEFINIKYRMLEYFFGHFFSYVRWLRIEIRSQHDHLFGVCFRFGFLDEKMPHDPKRIEKLFRETMFILFSFYGVIHYTATCSSTVKCFYNNTTSNSC